MFFTYREPYITINTAEKNIKLLESNQIKTVRLFVNYISNMDITTKMCQKLPSYNEIIHLIIEDEPPSYEKATGIKVNATAVSSTFIIRRELRILELIE